MAWTRWLIAKRLDCGVFTAALALQINHRSHRIKPAQESPAPRGEGRGEGERLTISFNLLLHRDTFDGFKQFTSDTFDGDAFSLRAVIKQDAVTQHRISERLNVFDGDMGAALE